MTILYQVNDKYVPYVAASIASVCENNSPISELYFVILGENLSDQSKNALDRVCNAYGRKILFPDTTQMITFLQKYGIDTYRGSYSVWFKLLFLDAYPEMFKGVERILYMDADTAVEGDISELEKMNLNDRAVGMVVDSLGSAYKHTIGMSSVEPYYNSGVILFDVGAWRDRRYSRRIVDVLRTGCRFANPDQDMINIVCRGDVCMLPVRYNVQPAHLVFKPHQYFCAYESDGYYSTEELEDISHSGIIYHFFRFLGEFPWDEGNAHPDRDRYMKYRACTSYVSYDMVRNNVTLITHIERVLYRILPPVSYLRIFKFFHTMYLRRYPEVK